MTRPSPKELRDQVLVITGAASGIGLAAAEAAARAGASLVLAARSKQGMDDLVEQIRAAGGEAIFVACDVSEARQVELVARTAVERFGRIDTWINTADVSIYGRLDEVSEADHRRLFDINFWGVVHGSMAALPYLRAQGGSLINVGSDVSDTGIPLQGMVTASKHAVQGFTDSLRIEIEELDRAPVSVTFIQPSAVDTPPPVCAQNSLRKESRLPRPPSDPEEVAQAVLEAAVHPTHDRRIGAPAVLRAEVRRRSPGDAPSGPSEESGVTARSRGTRGKK